MPVRRTNGVKGVIERVTIAREPRRVVLATNRKGDRPGGKIEQVTVKRGIVYRQFILAGVMQGHINSLPGPPGVLVESATERIKRRARICIQQGIAQPGLAHFANGQILSFVARVTETRFPVPRLEVIANIPQLTPQTDIEELVPVSELFTSWAGIIECRETEHQSSQGLLAHQVISRVASPTVKGLNGFGIGTLMPLGPLNPRQSGPGFLNGSGVNGTAASDESKYERAYLKSPNTVRYLSHRSRVNEP